MTFTRTLLTPFVTSLIPQPQSFPGLVTILQDVSTHCPRHRANHLLCPRRPIGDMVDETQWLETPETGVVAVHTFQPQ